MRFLRLLPLIFLLSNSPLQAQTANEIIEKYIEAIGGRARVDSLQAFVCSYELAGNDCIRYYQRPDLVRNELVNAATGVIVQTCYDGEVTWVYSNKAGKAPIHISEQFPNAPDKPLLSQPFISYLVDPAARGFVVSLAGKATVDSTSCFELRLLHVEAEKEFRFFVDAATFLIRKHQENNLKKNDTVVAPNGFVIDRSGNSTEVRYFDYRRFDGILFPLRHISTSTTQLGVSAKEVHFKNYKKIPPADVRLFQCFPDVPAPKFD